MLLNGGWSSQVIAQNLAVRNYNISSSDIRKRELDAEKIRGKKLTLLSYGRGEEFYEFRGQRGERTSQFCRKCNPKDH